MVSLQPISPLKRTFKNAAAAALRDYRFNRIYRFDRLAVNLSLPADTACAVLGSEPPDTADEILSDRFSYAGEDAYGFGLFRQGKLGAICWFWGASRFRDSLLWRLSANEFIMVDLVTAPQSRRLGLATLLIHHAAIGMEQLGMQNLYSWVWHSHHASYRAFERAGWRQIAWVLEARPFGSRRPLRLSWPAWSIAPRNRRATAE